MNKKNPYLILGVSQRSEEKEIRKAFRALAKKYHPDVNPGNQEAEEKFREINEAYEILSDEQKRKKLDEELRGASYTSQKGFAKTEQKESRKSTTSKGKSQMDFSDVSNTFTNFFGFRPK